MNLTVNNVALNKKWAGSGEKKGEKKDPQP